MRATIILAAVAMASANTWQGGATGMWWGSASSWSASHFPRTGESVKVPTGSAIQYMESSRPAYYDGATNGLELTLDGDVTVEDGTFVIGKADNQPQHCGVGAFSPWTTCTVKCDGGAQSRSRSLVPPRYGGDVCPHPKETQACNTHSCPKICSHTSCVYKKRAGDSEFRTIVMHNGCQEKNGESYHCEHHHTRRTWTLVGGRSVSHHNACVCYCDFEGGSSTITHRHNGVRPRFTRNIGLGRLSC